ncbi:AMP-binding protein [Burkholderia sp. R-69980]|nr:AMP-binding protein [Burkholderia sp. R-69980]
MSPDDHAVFTPDKPALVMGTSAESVTFAELSARSQMLARHLRERGLQAGDVIALLLENQKEFFEIAWAAQRTGLYYVPINWHLQSAEVDYILRDSGAQWLFTSAALVRMASASTADLAHRVQIGDRSGLSVDTVNGLDYAEFVAAPSDDAIHAEIEGQPMFYSSGTTGYPKGIKRKLQRAPFGTTPGWESLITDPFDVDAETVYLSPAPLYHAAPLSWTMAVQRRGGTVIAMERFDAAEALRLIEKYRVTHVQMVPTHFVQMLKLPEAVRKSFDHSSLRCVVHAAAPCPIEVKRQMIDWWGPIVHEYYGFSEGSGFTRISPREWLLHPGSVGKATLGAIRILDEQGAVLPPGETGTIWIENGIDFEYHNAPEKTAAAHDSKGRTTVGDIGYLDAEGYLYLTDRAAHVIISGGVNVYPQEAENVLIMHPDVADVAVIGVPNEAYGEEIKALIVPRSSTSATADLAHGILAFCRDRLAHYKCPRSIDFVDTLPRLPTGKLLKRLLRERYSNVQTAGAADNSRPTSPSLRT